MKPYLDFGPVYRALKEPAMFNSVWDYFDNVSANEADLDPEILYPNSVLVLAKDTLKNKRLFLRLDWYALELEGYVSNQYKRV